MDTRTDTNNLAELRAAAGLTQAEVARAINQIVPGGAVDAGTVSRWERGLAKPSPAYRRALARVLNTTVPGLGLTPPRPAAPPPTDLPFLQEPTITTVDSRVAASQQQWRAGRRALNAQRHALTQLATQVYDPARRVGATGLIAGPGWIPAAPVDLAAITLQQRACPIPPALDGTEAESVHVRPLAALTRPYQRYTQAIRDLDHPRLFENRAAWRLIDLAWTSGGAHLVFGDTWFFAAVDVNEVVSHELAYVCLDRVGQPTGRAPTLRDLPYRRLVGDPFDLTRRPMVWAISTLTIRGGGEPSFILHRRDSRSVAMAGGMLQVIPSGIFQPSSVLPAAVEADFDLWRNIMREYAEELLGHPEHDGDGRPVDYAAEPFAGMDAARGEGRLRVWCLGLALDALTLVGEILTVAVIDPEVFDAMARDFVEVNDEGTVVNQRLPFTGEVVDQVLASGRMAPAGAGCLRLAWQHRGQLLGQDMS